MQIREHEPRAGGIAGLWVPETGIIDYAAVARAYAEGLLSAGGRIATAAALTGVRPADGHLDLTTSAGRLRCRWLVNCAGLQSDRVARLCGAEPAVRIVPFRGDYYLLGGVSRQWVRGLIYPVPDPAFPFLGVHLTRTVDGEVEAGPNAVLAWSRHGYEPPSISARDTASTLGWGGFWRLAARHWRTGAYEWRRSLSRRLFARDLRRLVPDIRAGDLRRGGCGIRAQAVGRDGSLADDFVIERSDRALHVLNAPSPGATASTAIGRYIAERLAAELAA
jgi:L-2-hydroxyglutarate oxidase